MENPSLLSELLPIDELQLDRDIAYYLTSDVRMNAQPFEMHAPRPMATSPSSQSPSESEPGKEESISQKYRRRQKEELKHLQEQVAQLSGHLAVLTNVKALEAEGGSEWEQNSRLKRALEEQLKIAQALDQLLIKRPRLAVRPPNATTL
ncbi:hypothetical protein SPRG_14117 [Saprolegnia parasitica CBS 223.65]|uniref:BZIP domain-containing protein n=1 Tax=Saprolegnia parasitica (strain CBS 223.65) TaxID=695850 RepID=A0A067BVL5_SAPPC|nr:hypothetical protein SPRG_14117 [Saprolegnia parasitica CBS 223.65]KDO20885.1 hypothetical protein SPRG_14117 [Saprolegnia parasitica CBS 223.65]|eukprot:XP_012208375.1 hypothetical protein SPRG_14117 [Saprolegnia parasitica CBS 223.65]